MRSEAGRPPFFWAAPTSRSPIYYSWFSKGGEGENVSVTKALRGQKHLRSSGKGPQKWETGGAEPPGPEYRLTPAARSSHALFEGSDTTEAPNVVS